MNTVNSKKIYFLRHIFMYTAKMLDDLSKICNDVWNNVHINITRKLIDASFGNV